MIWKLLICAFKDHKISPAIWATTNIDGQHVTLRFCCRCKNYFRLQPL